MQLKVMFRSNKLKLVGLFSRSAVYNDTCVILSHGFLVSKEYGFFPELQKKFHDQGFNVLSFDYRGYGESEGEYIGSYRDMVFDLQKAIEFVQRHEEIKRVILLGHSMGATTAFMHARLEGVCGIVFCAGVCHVKERLEMKKSSFELQGGRYVISGKTGEYFAHEGFFDEGVNPLDVARKIQIPVLFLHGDEDTVVSVDESKALYAACSSSEKEIFLIKGANHGFKGFYDVVEGKSLDFVKKHML